MSYRLWRMGTNRPKPCKVQRHHRKIAKQSRVRNRHGKALHQPSVQPFIWHFLNPDGTLAQHKSWSLTLKQVKRRPVVQMLNLTDRDRESQEWMRLAHQHADSILSRTGIRPEEMGPRRTIDWDRRGGPIVVKVEEPEVRTTGYLHWDRCLTAGEVEEYYQAGLVPLPPAAHYPAVGFMSSEPVQVGFPEAPEPLVFNVLETVGFKEDDPVKVLMPDRRRRHIDMVAQILALGFVALLPTRRPDIPFPFNHFDPEDPEDESAQPDPV